MDRLLANAQEWEDSHNFITDVNKDTALSHIGEIDIQYISNKKHPDYRVAYLIDIQDTCHYFGYVEE
jgi:hypothetical protein